jgi:uncharacterized protein (TIGR04255 family)
MEASMLFAVDRAPSYSLTRAPLVQALAQVRFPLVADFQNLGGVAPLQNALRANFPYMEQTRVQELGFAIGPSGPSAAANETVNWQFTNDDGYLLEVGSGSATVSAGSAYEGVDEFASMFGVMLAALSAVGIPRCDRIGVRYLSVAPSLPTEARSIQEWFRPDVLGWAGSSAVDPDFVTSSIAQTQLTVEPKDEFSSCPASVQAIVRHGYIPAGAILVGIPQISVDSRSFFLDLDVSCAGHQPLSATRLLEQFHAFHREIDSFFFWSLSKKGGEYFGLQTRNS